MRPRKTEKNGSGHLFRMLGRLARKHGVPLRQSHVRVGKRASLMAGRSAHAKQFWRHERELHFLRSRLGRLIRAIQRDLRRRSAIEAVTGHLKTDGHLGRNCLKGHHGDRANPILTAAGDNFRLVLKRLRALLPIILAALFADLMPRWPRYANLKGTGRRQFIQLFSDLTDRRQARQLI